MKIILLILMLSCPIIGQIRVLPNSVFKYKGTVEFVTQERELYNYYVVDCIRERYAIIHSVGRKNNKAINVINFRYIPLSTNRALKRITIKLCSLKS